MQETIFKLLYLQKLYELSQKKSFGNVSDHLIEVAVKPFKHVLKKQIAKWQARIIRGRLAGVNQWISYIVVQPDF